MLERPTSIPDNRGQAHAFLGGDDHRNGLSHASRLARSREGSRSRIVMRLARTILAAMVRSMIVHSIMYYLTTIEGITWRNDDYTAYKIVKAVKGERFNGYFELKIGHKNHRFTYGTVNEFLPILFHAITATKMAAAVPGNFSIVPIPNSTAVVGSNAEFRTLEHAKAIAGHLGQRADVVPALRWIGEKTPGGSRDPQLHFRNLRAVARPAHPIVLYDDVINTGSQMIGSYRRLAVDATPPLAGFVVGRAVKDQKTPTIGWAAEDVPVQEWPIDFDQLFGPGEIAT